MQATGTLNSMKMRVFLLSVILCCVAASHSQMLKPKVGLLPGSGWDKLRVGSGQVSQADARRLIVELLRETNRFEAEVLDPKPDQGPPPIPGKTMDDVIGMLLDVIIEPHIVSFSNTRDRQRVPGSIGGVSLPGRAQGTVETSTSRVEVRFVIKRTPGSKALAEVTGKGSHSATGINAYSQPTGQLDMGRMKSSDLGVAFRNAVDDALLRLVEATKSLTWKCLVISDPKDGMVYIDRGSNSGLKVGMTLRVLEVGEPRLHPLTGEVLEPGAERTVGRMVVTRVDHASAQCRVESGEVRTFHIARY